MPRRNVDLCANVSDAARATAKPEAAICPKTKTIGNGTCFLYK